MPQDLQISILGLLWLVHLDGVGEVPWKWQRNWEFHSTYCVHTDLSPDTCICCCTLHVHSNQHKLFCGPPMGWNYLDFRVFYQAACCVSLQGPTSPNGTLTKPRLVAPSRKSLNTTSSSTVFSFQRFGPLMVLCVWAHVCMHVCVCMCLCVCVFVTCHLTPEVLSFLHSTPSSCFFHSSIEILFLRLEILKKEVCPELLIQVWFTITSNLPTQWPFQKCFWLHGLRPIGENDDCYKLQTQTTITFFLWIVPLSAGW